MKNFLLIFAVLLFILEAEAQNKKIVYLDSLDLTLVEQGWDTARSKRTMSFVGNRVWNPIKLQGKIYERGVGTHGTSIMLINLSGGSEKFSAVAGIDDHVLGKEVFPIEFIIKGDGKYLWRSDSMRKGDVPKKVELDVRGVNILELLVRSLPHTYNTHADWADAKFVVTGATPFTFVREAEAPYILTPKPSAKPRITGAKVFGVRPGSPFLFTVTATGDKPMDFEAKNLPLGLTLDKNTGQITGKLAQKGAYNVVFVARNKSGKAERSFKIVAGDNICLTPPMGWNSWNCWAAAVDAEKVKASATSIKTSGLIDHGWTYVNIDDAWQGKRGGQFNAIQGNEKFPDMKSLCDYVHGLGLKIGIYSSPWATTYAGYLGSSGDKENGEVLVERREAGVYPFHKEDVKQWETWGFDYLKYDWNPNDVPHTTVMSEALKNSGRDIIFSLSNTAPFKNASDWARLSNVWRTASDIVDTWSSLEDLGFDQQNHWASFAGPGHWNDPDMLIVGWVGWGPKLHPTRLTPNEQYSHISLWSILAAPMLIGCDLTRLDDFTLGLLTNDEVIDVNQDPLGKQGTLIKRLDNDTEVWVRTLEDGGRAIGLFNRSLFERKVDVTWKELGLTGKKTVRDLWRQKDLGVFSDKFEATVPVHGVVFVKVK